MNLINLKKIGHDRNYTFKCLFYCIILFVTIIAIATFKDYGNTGDEVYSRYNGIKNVEFYKSFGKKKDFLPVDNNLLDNKNVACHYPSFFDMSSYLLTKLFQREDYDYLYSHLLNALIGCMMFLFTGLLAKELGDWRSGVLGLCIIILSPKIYGEIFNNPKDIPFAAFYIMTIWAFIKWIKTLPKIRKKTNWLLIISLGLALGVRSGAFLLFFYITVFFLMYYYYHRNTLFNNQKPFKFYLTTILKILVLGYLIGIAFWPYALLNPFINAIKSFFFLSKFPVIISTLFEGIKYPSDKLPWYYTFKWIGISSPIIFLFGITCAIFYYSKFLKHKYIYGIIFLSTFLPLFLILVKDSYLYNTWRHIYFIYPGMVVLSAMGLYYFLTSKNVKIYFFKWGLILVGFILPLRFSIANHPFQSVYFNEFVGDSSNILGKYETDYYGNALKKAFNWLYENKLSKTNGKQRIAINFPLHTLSSYIKTINPNIHLQYVRYHEKNKSKFQYYIINSQLITPQELLNPNTFPPYKVLKTFYVDDLPICWIVKKESNLDFEAYQAYENKNIKLAYEKSLAYFKIDNKDIDNLYILMQSALQLQDIQTSVKMLEYAKKIAPNSINIQLFEVNLLLFNNKIDDAHYILTSMIEKGVSIPSVFYLYSQTCRIKGYTQEANYYENVYKEYIKRK